MEMPTLRRLWTSRRTVDAFGGLNRSPRTGEGEFAQMENLSSDFYPVLAPCPPREQLDITGVTSLGAGQRLFYTQGTELVLGDRRIDLGLSPDGNKILVKMGAYVVVFPDKKYASTLENGDCGSLEARFEAANAVLTPCTLEGADRIPDYIQSAEPLSPENGTLWLDTAASPAVLKEWSAASNLWAAVETAYVRIEAPGIGVPFRQYDGVTLSGAEALDGANVIWQAGSDFAVVSGVLEGQKHMRGLVLSRTVPEMDYVIECGNRLWGCRAGTDRLGNPVNEIYASKLGDFRNWNCFMGLSTDSYAVTVGTQGPFTGAITYLGNPLFFKEDCLYKIYGSYPAAFHVQSTACRGVAQGGGESLAIVGETLFYKSPMGVCAYDGSLPAEVGRNLGFDPLEGGVGAGFGGKYFLSLQEHTGTDALYVYDKLLGQWHRETGFGARQMVSHAGKLYGLDKNGGLWLLRGGKSRARVKWMARTGRISGWDGKRMVLKSLELQLLLANRARMDISVRYDDRGAWERIGTLTGSDRRFLLPIRPKPCSHLELLLEGEGDIRLLSLTRVLRQGGTA
ncbi:MAG: hypothetical protein SPI68_07725 [Candidatus Faecousia sp.]|nr:hypothetical protein [Eubacteriales bacterium]MDY6067555.1 hypothetical protein [Candidatus Faecousia sp.]